MKYIETYLRNEVVELKEEIKKVEKRLQKVPEGNLRISKKANKVECYYKNEEKEIKEKGKINKKGRYIRKSEIELAKQIAQRDYDQAIVKNAKERVRAIESFLRRYNKTNLKSISEKLHPCRKELLDNLIISDKDYVAAWQSQTYTGKGFRNDEQVITTERGERVRSKSEKIIADKLYMLDIPYHYEQPLHLKSGVTIYPDFTILKMPEREEVYLEHFGMLDDLDYINKTFYKIKTYEKNNVYIGVNLFVTHETSRNPLNTQNLDLMLRRLFYEDEN